MVGEGGGEGKPYSPSPMVGEGRGEGKKSLNFKEERDFYSGGIILSQAFAHFCRLFSIFKSDPRNPSFIIFLDNSYR